MRKALGFRVAPGAVHWAAVTAGAPPVLTAYDVASAPATFTEAAALSWYRARALEIIDREHPDAAIVRTAEPISRSGGEALKVRCRIEGVVLEACATRGLAVQLGPLATISRLLQTRSAKAYLDASEVRGLDWSSLRDKNSREAVLAAVAVVEDGTK
jgi:hypothetical protein